MPEQSHREGEMANAPKKLPRKVTWATVRQLALALPGMEESNSYGTPAMKGRGKLIARLKDDGETSVVRTGLDEQFVRRVSSLERAR